MPQQDGTSYWKEARHDIKKNQIKDKNEAFVSNFILFRSGLQDLRFYLLRL